MLIINPYVELLSSDNGVEYLKAIEIAGRTCYKSEDRITIDSAYTFVAHMMQRGHLAMIEHAPNMSMRFVCDRGVSHELVRHRFFSFAQESTRYCNYGKANQLVFVQPSFFEEWSSSTKRLWKETCRFCEERYLEMVNNEIPPQEARSILPNSLKTEVVITGNLREWRHFFELRTAPDAHPDMRVVATQALIIARNVVPIVFDDIQTNYKETTV